MGNPAKPLLFVISVIGLLQGCMGVPVGLFVGPWILGAAIASIAFAAVGLWLACSRFSRVSRLATIAWSALAIFLILAATILEPPSARDVVGIVWFALLGVLFGAVLVAACSRKADEFA